MQHFVQSNNLLFGISSGDFQLTNCSVDVICPPDCLPVISYLKTNSLRSRIFRISWRSQDPFC